MYGSNFLVRPTHTHHLITVTVKVLQVQNREDLKSYSRLNCLCPRIIILLSPDFTSASLPFTINPYIWRDRESDTSNLCLCNNKIQVCIKKRQKEKREGE